MTVRELSACWTDAFGAYRIPHARAGLAWVALWSKGDPSEAPEGPLSQVVVPATGDLRHDFGAPLGLREWRGRLVTRAAALSLGNHTLHLQRTSDGSYRSVVARRGVFELRLEAGEWTAALDDPTRPGTRVPLATFEVAAEDVEMELTMPGTTVVVELTGAGAAADPSAVVGLAARALDWHWPAWNAAHAEGARWVIEGVLPGEWVLVGGLRDAAVAESRFVVSAEDLVLERRLQLPGP